MTKFFGGVLSVIAVGVMLIAYGLLKSGPSAYAPDAYPPGFYPAAHAYGQQVYAPGTAYVPGTPVASPVNGYALVPAAGAPMATVPHGAPVMAIPAVVSPTQSAPAVVQSPAPARQVVRSSPRSGRDWTKTALIIGGTTAAGAGIGGIFGGKKGALIGAAIGGGASSIHQSTR